MARSIITLTTDFGTGSTYVAQMKGVILSINADATIVDLTHEIPPQDVRQGALALENAALRFPPNSIHVAVVDPGVGTARDIIYARIDNRHYVAPDNGLLDRLAARTRPDRIVALSNPKYWLASVSSTFHGRDIMAPAAAHLSLGLDADALGKAKSELVRLEWPEVQIVADKITGTIQSIDSFGNLVTDITEEMLASAPRDESVVIRCDDHETMGIFKTYADQPPMTLIAVIGSSGHLELSIVDDSAKIMLGVKVGTPVMVTW
jgi:S-adenosylmethionine hydrolase